MGYELIITEKPKAAQKIAEALSDGKVIKAGEKGVPYYTISHKNKEIVVGCAVGHLFGLREKGGNKWKYPVFDVEWVPTSEIGVQSKFSKKYLDTLKKLSKSASSFTVATDYDIEGEVIGLNVVRFIAKQKDAGRMKFSTLTKPDIVKAYENKSKTLDWGQAKAGETRHELDWYYGINLSRALTSAIKTSGIWKVLSSGRVQGPALKIIADKELEIKKFVSRTYWQIELKAEPMNKHELIFALHEKDKFFDKTEADGIFARVKGKKAIVKEVNSNSFMQEAPHPFDLTTLQTEAYRVFHISPKDTLAIAQNLYIEGLISYPRTSSQSLPIEIGFKAIIDSLKNQALYAEIISKLPDKLLPNNGKKTDPAHPAIYPTGIEPKKIGEREKKVYDLIVKRFLSTFGEPAIRETMNIIIIIESELFIAKGMRTLKRGWYDLYGPYVPFKENELPKVMQNEELRVIDISVPEKQTQPPRRYTASSIIKELEKRNLGTKATRAQIIDTLFQRGYAKGEQIEATDLGIKTSETLQKYVPEMLDEELTRHFEIEMDEIRENKKKEDEVLEEAKQVLTVILAKFKKRETEVGSSLKAANQETQYKMNIVGKCPVCKEGDLRVLFSRKSKKRFIACNRYPDCKTTFSIPQDGLIKATDRVCERCSFLSVLVIRKGRKPWNLCLNPVCPAKQEYYEKKNAENAANKANSAIAMPVQVQKKAEVKIKPAKKTEPRKKAAIKKTKAKKSKTII